MISGLVPPPGRPDSRVNDRWPISGILLNLYRVHTSQLDQSDAGLWRLLEFVAETTCLCGRGSCAGPEAVSSLAVTAPSGRWVQLVL